MDKKNVNSDCIIYASDAVPPVTNGPSVLIYRLFRHFPDNSYIFLSRLQRDPLVKIDEDLKLPCSYVYALNSCIWRLFPKFQSSSSNWRWLHVLPIFVRGMQVVREKSVKHLLVAPFRYSGTFLLSMCWLHCITRIPMSIYLFDMFDRERRDTLPNLVTSLIERMAVRMASHVFVMSEPLHKHYSDKYKINPILLPHPVDMSSYHASRDVEIEGIRQTTDPLKIVFAGMIYEAQLDAILNMVNVVNELSNVEFHIYSPIIEFKRRWMGITGHHVIFHGSVPHREIPNILQNADVLFLPIAFEYVYPHMIGKIPPDELRKQIIAGRKLIETASPSKLPEYLASGRPILIHAPEYSYIAWYGKTHKCAEVVDQPDLGMLRKAILRLANNDNYCESLVANARKAAEQHDAERVSGILQRSLGIF